MSHSNKTVSPLRQRMIEDMTLRKLGAATQLSYIRAVVKFTRFLRRSPDTATAEELRQFQLHLVEAGVSSTTINATLTGLRFLFEQTLDKPRAAEEDQARVRAAQDSRSPERRGSDSCTRGGR